MSPDPWEKAGAACGRGGWGLAVLERGDVPWWPEADLQALRMGRGRVGSAVRPAAHFRRESCWAVVGVGGVRLEQPESGFPGS